MKRSFRCTLTPADALPPYEPKTVRLTGLIGLGLIALAALIGLVSLGIGQDAPSALDTARLFLVLIGGYRDRGRAVDAIGFVVGMGVRDDSVRAGHLRITRPLGLVPDVF